MTTWAWIIVGWALTLAIVIGYVLVVVQRGRTLSRQVPPGAQRWM
jgi:hypothetical protein